MSIHYIVHDPDDSVGVIVVPDGIKAGAALVGWNMATDATLAATALDDIPVGHKLALRPHAVGEGIIKYGHDIGRVVQPIASGGHVHTQNVKTRRW